MLKDLLLVGLGAVFGLGTSLMTLAAPLYFPNAPHWIWHSLFWGGGVLMIVMIADGAIMLLESPIQVGTVIFGNISIFSLALAIIWQTYHPPELGNFSATFALPAESTLAEVSHEQYEQLKEVAAFVSKDEQGLDAEFDYANMIHFNILMWRKALFPETDTDEFNKLLPTLGGPYRFNSKYMTVVRERGGTTIIRGPNGLYYISQSPKYVTALAKTDDFLVSLVIPTNVKSALEGLKSTATWNIDELMFAVLNEKFKEDPQNFIFEDDIHSPDNGNISYAYRHQMKPLKPDADKVVAAIRSFLHID